MAFEVRGGRCLHIMGVAFMRGFTTCYYVGYSIARSERQSVDIFPLLTIAIQPAISYKCVGVRL